MWLAGVVGVAISIVGYLVAVIGAWSTYRSYDTRENIMGSGGLIGLFGVPVVCSLLGESTNLRPWRWIGVAASAFACAMTINEIWTSGRSPSRELMLAIVAGAGAVIGHANAVSLVPLLSKQRWLRLLTIAAAVATAALVVASVYRRSSSDLLERFVAAAGICAACGTIAIAVLGILNRRVERPAADGGLFDLTVICPRCNRKQTLQTGDNQCAQCGLRISIRIEEPRCPRCDYLLYGLTSDRCPECGEFIRAAPVPGAALT
jgi:hypothetical protein